MTDITRYDINEYGEIPLSNGRYVRWEDVEDLLVEHAKGLEKLQREIDSESNNYDHGYDDGWEEAKALYGGD